MMDKIATMPVKRLLLAGVLILLSLSLLALRSSENVAEPAAFQPTATVVVSSQAPPAGVVLLRITPVPPEDGDRQPARAATLSEPAGTSTAASPAALRTSLPALPAPSVTPRTMALPGAGSEYDRPERVASLAHDAQENRPALAGAEPQSTPTPQPLWPPTRIVAPSIGLDAKIVPVGWNWVKRGGLRVAQWQVPKHKVGWHNTSALPGLPGNTVLSGHRNIYTEVFRHLPKLEPGDEITLYAGDEAYVYIVAEKHIVKELGVPESVRAKNAKWIAPSDDVRLTLVTCAPYKAPGNTHRVIVVARPGSLQSTG